MTISSFQVGDPMPIPVRDLILMHLYEALRIATKDDCKDIGLLSYFIGMSVEVLAESSPSPRDVGQGPHS